MSREYASVSPDKWRSKTGRQLRGDPWAMVIQDYLITCPLSEMTGAYYLPKCMIIAETGISPSELDRVMVKLQELDFCRYYEEDEYIFVRNMARYQISQTLNERDNRRAKVRKDLERLPEDVREDFIREYNVNFNLGYAIHEDTQTTQKKSRNKIQTTRRTASSEHDYAPDFGAASAAISGSKTHQRNGAELSEIEEVSDSFINKGLKHEEIGGLDRGFSDSDNSLGRGFEGASKGLNESKQAPSKPGTGTGTGTGTRAGEEEATVAQKSSAAAPPLRDPRATHRFDLVKMPDDWRRYCERMRPELDPDKVFYEFSAYWTLNTTAKAVRNDRGWARTWQNHVVSVSVKPGNVRSPEKFPDGNVTASAPTAPSSPSAPPAGVDIAKLAAMRF